MTGTSAEHPLCYSAHLVRPFVEFLQTDERFPRDLLEGFSATDPDERIPVSVVHQMLAVALDVTGDPDLGLKVAAHVFTGDMGTFDYLLSSGATVEDAIALAIKYTRLVNDALEISVERGPREVRVILHNLVALPRAAEDFEMAGFFLNHALRWVNRAASELRIAFTHPRPTDVREYEKIFSPATLEFRADVCSFTLPKAYLGARLERADSRLHQVIERHAEQILSGLPKPRTVADEVRALLMQELSGGNPGVMHIAERLGMSVRTLGRRLEREGTTFKDVLDDLRRKLALGYVGGQDLNLSAVALLLGFSQTAPFHRAFRRWTGVTPLQYRRSRKR